MDDVLLMHVLNFLEFFAQLFNPGNNKKGKFTAMGTHFAWLLTFEGHPPFILERLRDGVQFKKVDEHIHGLRVGKKLPVLEDLEVTVVKMHTLHQRVSLEHVRQWLDCKRQRSYNLVVNNCKHFAYDPWNVWVRFINHVFW